MSSWFNIILGVFVYIIIFGVIGSITYPLIRFFYGILFKTKNRLFSSQWVKEVWKNGKPIIIGYIVVFILIIIITIGNYYRFTGL